MSRDYKDWEKCSLNMSGIHTWSIVKLQIGEKKRKFESKVQCNRCGTEPPTVHRARIYTELDDARKVLAEQKKKASEWRKAVRGR